MQIGMIGLGRMGSHMVRRLMRGGHQCVVYDHHAEAVGVLRSEGAASTVPLGDFIANMIRRGVDIKCLNISATLSERFASRGYAGYANRLLSAMRKQFGGHDEKKAGY